MSGERNGARIPEGNLRRALSHILALQGDQAAAIAMAREAVQILERELQQAPAGARGTRDNARRQAAHAYLQVARLAVAARQPDEAAAALSVADQYARIVGLAEITATLLVLSADVALQKNDAARAQALALKGRAEAERTGALGSLADAHRLVAVASEQLGQLDTALTAADAGIQLVESARSQLEESGTRAGFLESRQGVYGLAVRIALSAGKVAEAFAYAERGRSRAFLDLLGQQAVLSKGKTATLVQEEVRLRARLAEAQAMSEDEGSSHLRRDAVAAADREYEAFLGRVRKESGEQASMMAVEPVTLADVQSFLPEGTTLLEYLVTEQDVVIWIVDRTSVAVRRIPMLRAALVTDVRDFRAAIATQAPLPEVQQQAQALYTKLLAPARDAIRGDRILVVPHDVLHYLPFGALRSPDGRWLVEDFTIGTMPSASVLKYLAGKGAGASPRVLALGNPDVGSALALPYAEREARALGELFPGVTTVLTRGAATEHRAKELGPQAGIIHFAAHGQLDEADPMASALLLAPGDGDDGRLEVREVFRLELDARLVVLSACETGLGKLSRGDELVGLQRAFLYAGTPAVVTTLWKVDDRSSYLLMRAFYERLATAGPAQALRAAQRGLFASFPHPFAWAAFSLTGAPR
jgi:CHAT domain-containing protein